MGQENHLATDHSVLSPGLWEFGCSPGPQAGSTLSLVTSVYQGALGWEGSSVY